MEIEFLPREGTRGRRRGGTTAEQLSGLTVRQQQILNLVLNGRSNKLIARELGISPNTVKVHIQAIFRELRVHSRMSLAVAFRPIFLNTCQLDSTGAEQPSTATPIFFHSE
jgi:DNA-binding NarL/FixJ family response regulator